MAKKSWSSIGGSARLARMLRCIRRARIGNRGRVYKLRNALLTTGEHELANLLREIPSKNGGVTFPDIARKCMEELDRFERMEAFGRHIELVDATTGSKTNEGSRTNDGPFRWDGRGHNFSLDDGGHLDIHHAQSGLIFHAKAFSQVKTPEGQFIYTNLADGAEHVLPDGLRDPATSEYPLTLKVVIECDRPSRYESSIVALRRVSLASIEVNHSVSWC